LTPLGAGCLIARVLRAGKPKSQSFSSFCLDSFFDLAYLRKPIGVDKSVPCLPRARVGHHRQREFSAKSPEIPALHRLIKRRPPV
jgi:hypothetical protein